MSLIYLNFFGKDDLDYFNFITTFFIAEHSIFIFKEKEKSKIKKMTEYTLSDFLGIFLIFFPTFIFLTLVFQKGLYGLVENYFTSKDDYDEKNFFHHHFHYKAK